MEMQARADAGSAGSSIHPAIYMINSIVDAATGNYDPLFHFIGGPSGSGGRRVQGSQPPTENVPNGLTPVNYKFKVTKVWAGSGTKRPIFAQTIAKLEDQTSKSVCPTKWKKVFGEQTFMDVTGKTHTGEVHYYTHPDVPWKVEPWFKRD
jgi:hypothetical protein